MKARLEEELSTLEMELWVNDGQRRAGNLECVFAAGHGRFYQIARVNWREIKIKMKYLLTCLTRALIIS